ncbi:unnamed protein product [Lymnaea stagnalis]|uniref:Uncharacterized protein n=1 Tax=Lymnaea stagnalis TaxID=6523 RepID=A0AAV2I0H5_LYMST
MSDLEYDGQIKKKCLPTLPPCKVCGEHASGFHYGVNSCGACKGFFLRSLARTEPYTCLTGGQCQVGPEVKRRKTCQKCRFDKCLRLGMSKNAIKIGRYTYSKRTQDTLELKQLKHETLAQEEESSGSECESSLQKGSPESDEHLQSIQPELPRLHLLQERLNSGTSGNTISSEPTRFSCKHSTSYWPNSILENESGSTDSESHDTTETGSRFELVPATKSRVLELHFNKNVAIEKTFLKSTYGNFSYSPKFNQPKKLELRYLGGAGEDFHQRNEWDADVRALSIPSDDLKEKALSCELLNEHLEIDEWEDKEEEEDEEICEHTRDVLPWSSEFTEHQLHEWIQALLNYHNTNVFDNNSYDKAKLKERTDLVYNEHRLQETTFGQLKALDRELYFEIYKSTGLDVDGRRTLLSSFLLGIHNEISTVIKFFKQIPGFRELPMSDQILLVKGCSHEYQILSLYRGWDNKTRCMTFSPLGETLTEQDLRKVFPDEALSAHIDMAVALQKLDLTVEQIIILKAIVATAPDRDELASEELVAAIHWKLVNCLLLLLWKQGRHPLQKFGQIMSVLTEMRKYSVFIRSSYTNIRSDVEELTGRVNLPFIYELFF